ncbi:hypothetical protein V8G54_011376 [Vigna mungo]|uniref:Uncharacterized protein n=1 Tax=Vigna mungo TaxID=3915 RepID=A0AAQ3NR90_VIGMU
MKRGAAAPSIGDRGMVILSGEIGQRVSYYRNTIFEVTSEGLRHYQRPHKRDASFTRPPLAISLAAISVRSCDADGNTRQRRRQGSRFGGFLGFSVLQVSIHVQSSSSSRISI